MHVTTRVARAISHMREGTGPSRAPFFGSDCATVNRAFGASCNFRCKRRTFIWWSAMAIENENELARAMKGRGVRVAKSVNQVLRRAGVRSQVPASSQEPPFSEEAPRPEPSLFDAGSMRSSVGRHGDRGQCTMVSTGLFWRARSPASACRARWGRSLPRRRTPRAACRRCCPRRDSGRSARWPRP